MVTAASCWLAACAEADRPGLGAPPPVAIATTPLAIAPPYVQIPDDTCGANALGWLVGRPRSDIPIPTDLSHRRVACTACPGSGDVRPDRLNILFDLSTGRIAKLTCG